jgi:hypothetical protein
VAADLGYDDHKLYKFSTDYYCDIHGNETGSVIIFSQNEETMTNTERLRFLGKIFNINPPDVYAHLKG